MISAQGGQVQGSVPMLTLNFYKLRLLFSVLFHSLLLPEVKCVQQLFSIDILFTLDNQFQKSKRTDSIFAVKFDKFFKDTLA